MRETCKIQWYWSDQEPFSYFAYFVAYRDPIEHDHEDPDSLVLDQTRSFIIRAHVGDRNRPGPDYELQTTRHAWGPLASHPPKIGHPVRQVHYELIKRLEAAGWEKSGRHKSAWWAVTLEREVEDTGEN